MNTNLLPEPSTLCDTDREIYCGHIHYRWTGLKRCLSKHPGFERVPVELNFDRSQKYLIRCSNIRVLLLPTWIMKNL